MHLLKSKNRHFIANRIMGSKAIETIMIHRYKLLKSLEERWENETDNCPFIDVCCSCEDYNCMFFSEENGCYLRYIEGGKNQ